MNAPNLREVLRLVETLGLAPLLRISNTRPKEARHLPTWQSRRAEVEREVARNLAAHGAVVEWSPAMGVITFSGIQARSNLDLHKALRNWKERAEKRLPRRRGAK